MDLAMSWSDSELLSSELDISEEVIEEVDVGSVPGLWLYDQFSSSWE